MSKKRILCFGNPYVKEDNAVFWVVKDLKSQDFEFVFCSQPEQVLLEKRPILLDVVSGIKEPVLLEDVELLEENKSLTSHDFDLAKELLLYKQLKILDKITIIGIPSAGDRKEIIKKTEKLLSTL